jgi:AbrB family looped-hinge helix DNA binding protein
MMATVDRTGRVVIPAEVRKRLGFTPGTELNLAIDGLCSPCDASGGS